MNLAQEIKRTFYFSPYLKLMYYIANFFKESAAMRIRVKTVTGVITNLKIKFAVQHTNDK